MLANQVVAVYNYVLLKMVQIAPKHVVVLIL